MTHENFWRQLLRWLVDGVPNAGRDAHARPSASKPVSRSRSPPRSSTRPSSSSTTPTSSRTSQDPKGTAVDVPLQWTGEQERRVPRHVHRDRAGPLRRPTSKRPATARPIGTGTTHVRAAPGDAEYFDATMHAARLKRVAEETGGRFYTSDNVASLPEDSEVHRPRRDDGRRTRSVAHADRAVAARGLIGAEWGYRRAVGMA